MGLACSPDIYQEKMSELFIDMIFVIVYQDNILVLTSGSFDDHLRQLENVFKWLHHNNLQVNANKIKLLCIGNWILRLHTYERRYQTATTKVNAILQVALPRRLATIKQVQSFIGMLNHYKAMIPCRSHLLTAITALIKKNIKFEWTMEHQQAFDSLKNSLACKVVLAYWTTPFLLKSTPMPRNTKLNLSLPKKTSHLHSIQGNLLILKQDTLSQNSNCLQ